MQGRGRRALLARRDMRVCAPQRLGAVLLDIQPALGPQDTAASLSPVPSWLVVDRVHSPSRTIGTGCATLTSGPHVSSCAVRKQPLSTRRSEAGAAFSVATREQEKQVFISNAHSMAQYIVRNGPGPDYQHESAFGKQVSSGHRLHNLSELLAQQALSTHAWMYVCPQMTSSKKSAATPPFREAPRPGMHVLYAETGGGRRHITSVGENKPGKLRALH